MKYYLFVAFAFIFILGCNKDDSSPTEPEKRNPGEERTFELTDSVNITMVWIPAGSFNMGSPEDEDGREFDEGPIHDVSIETGYWMGKYEVTQSQWKVVTGSNPSATFGDNHPVEQVSWDDIHEDFLPEIGDNFRLPSEAEWEYACRAGTTTRFYWGEDPDSTEIDNYTVCRLNDVRRHAEVGTKQSNPFGLHDMTGNVYEWCEDDYHFDYDNAPINGSPWIDNPRGDYRVLHGGSWYSTPGSCRSAGRSVSDPRHLSFIPGFRLVRDADQLILLDK